MSTQLLIKKLSREVETLRRDVSEIKRAVLQTEQDPEGPYRVAFVRRMLARVKERPHHRFLGSRSFLEQVHGRAK